jgi:hypothetical protein
MIQPDYSDLFTRDKHRDDRLALSIQQGLNELPSV